METWNCSNFDENVCRDGDHIIIGKFTFIHKGNFFTDDQANSVRCKENMRSILGDNWIQLIIDSGIKFVYGGDSFITSEGFSFSPSTFNTFDTNRLLKLMIDTYNRNNRNDSNSLNDLNEERTWTRFNYHECDEVKNNDIIKFNDVFNSSVCYNHIATPHKSNDAILTFAFGKNYAKIVDKVYGYPAGIGQFPTYNERDFAAATRIMKAIFNCMYKEGHYLYLLDDPFETTPEQCYEPTIKDDEAIHHFDTELYEPVLQNKRTIKRNIQNYDITRQDEVSLISISNELPF